MQTQRQKLVIWVITTLTVLVIGGVLYGSTSTWLPWVQGWIARTDPDAADSDGHDDHDHDHGDDDHAHGDSHAHDHPGHSEDTSIEISSSGLRNIGFRPIAVQTTNYFRTVTVPAMVVERPGRSQVHITAPFTGVVTRVAVIRGAAVEPGAALFEIRLTHEELVTAQSNLIRTAESLEVVNREIARLQGLGEGVVPGRRILEQEYEKQKLEAGLRAERQALLLHGLDETHVDNILSTKELLRTLTVSAPMHHDENEVCEGEHLYHVQSLDVALGQQVEAGHPLCVLADHCELFIEGQAFADDAERLREAAMRGWGVTASLMVGDRTRATLPDLKLLYLADHVDPVSRAFRFYLRLPNQIVMDQTDDRGIRFLDWRFKPGQRMELEVPVELWEKRFVVPVEAIVEEGAETYVYQQNGDHFDRVPVHVEYRDQRTAIIANDGALFPGDVIAARGAYQMHLAIKNKSGGGVDPHAGHNH